MSLIISRRRGDMTWARRVTSLTTSSVVSDVTYYVIAG